MRRRVLLVLAPLVAIGLDTILFHQVNLLGVRPDALLCVVAVYGVLEGTGYAALTGLAAGLFLDIFFGRMVGLYAACYLATGMVAGHFHGKFYADNAIVPAAVAAAGALVKECVAALAALLAGARFNYFLALAEYIIPCALMSGLCSILLYWASKPLLTGQMGKRDRKVIAR